MKIAILDLTGFASGGDVTWLRTFRRALTEAGHEVTQYRYHLLKRDADVQRAKKDPVEMAGLLNDHDLVVIPDATCHQHTQLRKKEVNANPLLDVLDHVTVPVHVGLHAHVTVYPDTDYTWELLRRATSIFTTSEDLLGTWDADFGSKLRVNPYLPYYRMVGVRPFAAHRWQGFMITGRLTLLKGQRRLLEIADGLTGPVQMWGRSMASFGGVTDSMKYWHYLQKQRGFEVLQPENPGKDEPWILRTQSGNRVQYAGSYDDPRVPYQQATLPTCHVNLTRPAVVRGHLEYTSLEAMDAGMLVVVPREHVTRADGVTPLEYDPLGIWPIGLVDDDPTLQNALNFAIPASAANRTKLRAALENNVDMHAPSAYVSWFLSEVVG